MSLPLLPSPVLLRRSAMSLCPPVAPRRVLPMAPDPATKSSFGVPSAQELPQHALRLYCNMHAGYLHMRWLIG
ncbi:hypothetical protein PVAP13_3KG298600 [Panicum virgatum]|uniref:Uncharacterized protein n=1 Tax=Panicum virgatum TaxID=38727 RepID=A0A8T0USV4_PANVG|nr:hypothetical protein PVAP13_3KG298600 [Panicum virgatum]